MTQLKQFSAGLVALAVTLTLQGGATAATDEAPGFRILSDQEITAHQSMMNTLRGKARDDYRNAQYEQLRQRALDNGFQLPPSPPWAAQPDTAGALAGPDAAPTAAAAISVQQVTDEAAARHAEMRERLEAQQGPSAQASSDLRPLEPQEVAEAQQQPAATPQASETTAEQPAGEGIAASRGGAMPAAAGAAETVPVESGLVESTAPEEPRFAPVEELAAAQKINGPPPQAAAPAAAPPPAAPPAPAAPPTPALPPAPPAAPPVAESAPVAARPGAYPAEPAAPAVPAPVSTAAEAAPDAPVGPEAMPPGYGSSDAMTAYRESMRARFDEYMKERQVQREETIQRQREQHAAQMEQHRTQANRQRPQPYPYPAMPAYGPRYPAAFPGYRTPYWQQPPQE